MRVAAKRSFDGKSVLVTGSSRGLGLAFVDALAARGALVYAGYRDWDGVPEGLRDRAGVVPVRMDLNDQQSIADLPMVDYVLNNAGINGNAALDTEDVVEILRSELEVNVLGTLRVISRYLPLMAERSHGGFINIISDLALNPFPFCATYSASKAALHSLCQSLQAWGSTRAVGTLNVYPSALDTRLTRGLDIPKLSPDEAAQQILAAWEQGDEEAFI